MDEIDKLIKEITKKRDNGELGSELSDYFAEENAKEKKLDDAASQVIEILNSFDTFERSQVAKKIGEKIHTLHYSDGGYSLDNLVIRGIINGQINGYGDEILKEVKFIFRQQKYDNDNTFGDIDQSVKIYQDNDELSAMSIRDNATCSSTNFWLIVLDKKENKVHIRTLSRNSDYPKSDYPDKLGIQFYKDRNFNLEYDKKLHMSNLGSVYGDIRDRGYILSYQYGRFSNNTDDKQSFLPKLKQFVSVLSYVYYGAKERWNPKWDREEKLNNVLKN